MLKKCICIVIMASLFLSGCTRVTELDEKAFVTAIGFDKGENYNLRFTFVFTNPTKSGSKDDPKEKDETVVIEAPSLYSAMEQINNFMSKTIELTHTQTVIFSEELAREGIGDFIYMLVRSSHFRPNTYVCIADKSSMEFLETVNPVQTYHLEKYFQLIFNKMTSGTRGDMYLYDSYFRLLSESGAGVLPYCAINEISLKQSEPKEEPSEKKSEEPTEGETVGGEFAENTDDYAINTVAGDSINQSDNNAEIQGVGIIKDGYMISILGRLEALSLQMITSSMPNSYITLSDPQNPDKMITCYVGQKDKAKISIECKENPVIEIKIKLEGDFTEVGGNAEFIKNPPMFEKYFEEKTKEAIVSLLEKTTREFDCDVFGFSEAAKSNFLTVQEWKAYNWKEKFKNAQYDVNVDITMRTYGELSQKPLGDD